MASVLKLPPGEAWPLRCLAMYWRIGRSTRRMARRSSGRRATDDLELCRRRSSGSAAMRSLEPASRGQRASGDGLAPATGAMVSEGAWRNRRSSTVRGVSPGVKRKRNSTLRRLSNQKSLTHRPGDTAIAVISIIGIPHSFGSAYRSSAEPEPPWSGISPCHLSIQPELKRQATIG